MTWCFHKGIWWISWFMISCYMNIKVHVPFSFWLSFSLPDPWIFFSPLCLVSAGHARPLLLLDTPFSSRWALAKHTEKDASWIIFELQRPACVHAYSFDSLGIHFLTSPVSSPPLPHSRPCLVSTFLWRSFRPSRPFSLSQAPLCHYDLLHVDAIYWYSLGGGGREASKWEGRGSK